MKNEGLPQLELAAKIQHALEPIAKQHGVAAKIEVFGPVRRISPSKPFQFDKHRLVIKFEPLPDAPLASQSVQSEPAAPRQSAVPDSLARLVRALDRAEHTPGHSFVAIKWFRDQALAREGLSRAEADEVLSRAIAQELILTAKISNPNNPQFPTTTVRLNRSDARVTSLLETKAGPLRRFQPIDLGGISLSEAVLRDRR